jgi:hypothetical protein
LSLVAYTNEKSAAASWLEWIQIVVSFSPTSRLGTMSMQPQQTNHDGFKAVLKAGLLAHFLQFRKRYS